LRLRSSGVGRPEVRNAVQWLVPDIPATEAGALGLLFDKLWVRRVPEHKRAAAHGQQVDVIDSYVARADYPRLRSWG
jgi:hypothetical protein